MSLSPSFSDFSASTGSGGSFTPGSGFAHDRAAASSMNLVPTAPLPTDSPNSLSPDTMTNLPPRIDRRNGSPDARSGRSGVERRQFGSSHSGLSDDGRDLASAIDQYKLQHHRRYLTCDEMLVVLRTLGYERSTVAGN